LSRIDTTRIADAPRIVVLTVGGPLEWITVNALARRFGPVSVLIEEPEPRSVFLKRRLRKLGPLEVAGQMAFALLQKAIARRSAARVSEIHATYGLETAPAPECPIHLVGSVNSDACRAALRRLDPDVVVVHGTRIIRRDTLRAIRAPFINYHAGINPKYRGQHGGYWARAARDLEHLGVTVHLVDEGVDTGGVLYQARVEPTADDNITTYQHLQAAVAQPLIVRAVEDALSGSLRPRRVELPSRQWFHPTIWGYLRTGLAQGVW
jgi:folate-dependent phosphoribosylglycinamide formyltransferase PurN